MNVIGKDVIHKSMGIGTIAKLDGNTMLVQFKTKDVKFIYPDAFKQFLAFINPNDAEEMAIELSTIDEQKRQRYLRDFRHQQTSVSTRCKNASAMQNRTSHSSATSAMVALRKMASVSTVFVVIL